MPLTLQDAARLSQDMLVRGVIETIVEESAVLRYLPFVSVVGNSLRYNRESSLGDVDFYAVGDTWSESALVTAEKTAKLAILGGDADVDAFLQQTYSDPNDLRALVVSAKARALAHTFSDSFFNGDTALDANEFDGVRKLSSGSRTMNAGQDGAVLTLDQLDELIDMVKPGMPHVLFMSNRSRRKLSTMGQVRATSL